MRTQTLRRSLAVGTLAVTSGMVPMAAGQADITHQEIQDAIRYPTTAGAAPINGRYGYAWGSYTCNIGATSLAWINGGTPALAMNAYRLYDGRLMQIGLGNAKHSCCVANGSGCGTCSTTGTGLRPGCRDIYNASFNGGQTRLGPRSGINPYTSTFSAIPAGSGDALFRRVQVSVSDMDATGFAGARFFAEGVYVCDEELPAAQLNNATYRPMNVANTGATPTYAWSITGATAAGSPAILAWRDHGLGLNVADPSVRIVTADVPAEGRFYVGSKVIDLGGGLYRYEYAVFNLNSDRSGESFRVTIPATATVTNIGFHAPDYHSGEVYSNTDWSSSRVGSTLTWSSTEKFEANPNANALRWGTMYNFWFTANVAPAAALGEVSLGLFKTGSPASIVATGLQVPSTPAPCAADFNNSGGLDFNDIFDFLNAWFANLPTAYFNGGALDVQDIFDFLNAWFAGC
ncbi:MAG: hypothetical protein K2W85_10625 [Phycisphaerales bacterium]|nr:hypothetical protein [Phycisphaerales bacterium]